MSPTCAGCGSPTMGEGVIECGRCDGPGPGQPDPPPWTPVRDAIRSWLVCLLPRWLCRWLWSAESIPLGRWAPHILGRVFGVTGKRIR